MDITNDIMKSWSIRDGGINSTEELKKWICRLNEETKVKIVERPIEKNDFWFFDEDNGEITNKNKSFFTVKGIKQIKDRKCIKQQPVIIQSEIGYLGIICKKIDNVLYFLMQAKIEPGNVNCVQISPTIQATKSNFTRAHGGRSPYYLEFFKNSKEHKILFDQVQSEQSSRFYKKRNRNIILQIDSPIEVYPNFKWMTLGQIKELMSIDNLVNMDTRTVLSGIPLISFEKNDGGCKYSEFFSDKSLWKSIYAANPFEELPQVYRMINDFKMFGEISIETVPLGELSDWIVDKFGVTCKNQADFEVRFYDIEIEGREVQHWCQPLFKAAGKATFGLLTKVENGTKRFLVKLKEEIGSFDGVELGPTIQWEYTESFDKKNSVEKVFCDYIQKNKNIICDVILSEEGGRFYHEQNRNVILEIDENELDELPEGYVWVSYSTLNYLVQINNCLNIQLRNLLSLLDI